VPANAVPKPQRGCLFIAEADPHLSFFLFFGGAMYIEFRRTDSVAADMLMIPFTPNLRRRKTKRNIISRSRIYKQATPMGFYAPIAIEIRGSRKTRFVNFAHNCSFESSMRETTFPVPATDAEKGFGQGTQ
jgi:hypothetical protein